MSSENTFQYSYDPSEKQEVLSIRKKYLPKQESKLEELKRLDNLVQNSGVTKSLCVGITGMLIFGLGMCLAMKVIGNMTWLGILLGLVGMAGVLLAFPVYRNDFEKAKERYTPRILQLTDELAGEK